MKKRIRLLIFSAILLMTQNSNAQQGSPAPAPIARCKPTAVAHINLDGFNSEPLIDLINNNSSCPSGSCFTVTNPLFLRCSDVGNIVAVTISMLTVINGQQVLTQCPTPTMVTVKNDIDPKAQGKDGEINLPYDANGILTIPASQLNNGSKSPCGLQLSVDPPTLNCASSPSGLITSVDLVAKDLNSGKEDRYGVDIVPYDDTPPIVTCNSRTVFLNLSGESMVQASSLITSTDPCTALSPFFMDTLPSHTFTCADAAGKGQNLILVQSSDNNGNISGCISEVTVKDPEFVVECKDPFSVSLDASSGIARIGIDDVFLDHDDPCEVKLHISPSIFNLSNVGNPVTVTLTATNISNVSSTCTTKVSVSDNCFILGPSSIFTLSPPFPTNDVRTLAIDEEDNIWVGTSGSGIFVYTAGHWVVPYNDFSMSGFVVRAMRTNPVNGDIWVAMSKTTPCLGQVGGIYVYSDIFHHTRRLPPIHAPITVDESSTFEEIRAYLLSVMGLDLPTGSNYWDFLSLYNSELQSLVVRSLEFNKKTDDNWAGCTPQVCQPGYNGGLAYEHNDTFHVVKGLMPPYQNQDRMVTAIAAGYDAAGSMYVGVGKSCNSTCSAPFVVQYDSIGNLKGPRWHASNTNGQLPLTDSTSTSLAIRSLHSDRNGHLWVGGEFGVSVKFTVSDEFPALREWKLLDKSIMHCPADAIVNFDAIEEDENGAIYIGTTKGLLKFDGQNPNFASVNSANHWNLICINGSTNYNVTAIRIDKKRTVWVSTRTGIFRLPNPGAIVRTVTIDRSNSLLIKTPLQGVLIRAIDNTGAIISELFTDANGEFQRDLDIELLQYNLDNDLPDNTPYLLRFFYDSHATGIATSTRDKITIEIPGYEPELGISDILIPLPMIEQIYSLIQSLKEDPKKVKIDYYKNIIEVNYQARSYGFADLDLSLFQINHDPIPQQKIDGIIERLGSTFLSLYASSELLKSEKQLIDKLPEPIMNLVSMLIEESKVTDKLAAFVKDKSGVDKIAASITQLLHVDIVLDAALEHEGISTIITESEQLIKSGLERLEDLIPNNAVGAKLKSILATKIGEMNSTLEKSVNNLESSITEHIAGRAQIDEGTKSTVDYLKDKLAQGLIVILQNAYIDLTEDAIKEIIKYPVPFNPVPGTFSSIAPVILQDVAEQRSTNEEALNAVQFEEEFQAELDTAKSLQSNWAKKHTDYRQLTLGVALTILEKFPIAAKIEKAVTFATLANAYLQITNALVTNILSQVHCTEKAFGLPLTFRENTRARTSLTSVSFGSSDSANVDLLSNALNEYNNQLNSIRNLIVRNSIDTLIQKLPILLANDTTVSKTLSDAKIRLQSIANSDQLSSDFSSDFSHVSSTITKMAANKKAFYLHLFTWMLDTSDSQIKYAMLQLADSLKAANLTIAPKLQNILNSTSHIAMPVRVMVSNIKGPRHVFEGSSHPLRISCKNFGTENADSVVLKIKATSDFIVTPDSVFIGSLASDASIDVAIQLNCPATPSLSTIQFIVSTVSGEGDYGSHTVSTIKNCSTHTFYADVDKDGFGDSTFSIQACQPPLGFVTDNTDCDDSRKSVHPGSLEICNQLDDNCSGQIDEGLVRTYYRDEDADGFGTSNDYFRSCTLPAGYVTISGDCNDTNSNIHPFISEVCNSLDDNCDGHVDEGCGSNTFYADDDGDNFGNLNKTFSSNSINPPPGYVSNTTDCDDKTPFTHPGAIEYCNGIDDNCNGIIDDGSATTTFFRDGDADGFGNPLMTVFACIAPSGYVLNNTDCNDNSSFSHPGGKEICNGIDDNCNGIIDEGLPLNKYYRDSDNDGFGNRLVFAFTCAPPPGFIPDSTDCNDGMSTVHPNASETCNRIDDNCNGIIDEGVQITFYRDFDNDGFGNPSITTLACTAPSGFVLNNNDCNDANSSVKPTGIETCNLIDDNCNGQVDENVKTTYYRDADSDGYGNLNITTQDCSVPSGYVSNSLDCNDANTSVKPTAIEICNLIDDNCNGQIDEGVQLTFYRDADHDGYGNSLINIQACSLPSGYTTDHTDCDDGKASAYPGATELCNGVDDNCNGAIDEGVKTLFYRDVDGDGFGNPKVSNLGCSAASGFVSNNTDCIDSIASIHPGAIELCNGIDDNCDGVIDIASCDRDGDGVTIAQGDCDDNNSSVHPGAIEICNSIDDNCNGTIDEGVKITFFRDADGDGFGNGSVTTQACSAPIGYVLNSSDCNDANALVHQGVIELCNFIDDNCNGQTDEGCDLDGDGFNLAQGDCNDNNPGIHPGAPELCNGIDDNCNGTIDEGVKITFFRDADGDGFGTATDSIIACTAPAGYVANKSDCNDANGAIKPTAVETCNSIDDNCNGSIDEGVKITFFRDSDGDGFGNPNISQQACTAPSGYVTSNTDCNDASTAIKPTATELCNNIDDNCNGSIDEGVRITFFRDADNDGFGKATDSIISCTTPVGYVANKTDCNDANAAIKPTATEVCNNIDDNCNGTIDEGVRQTYFRDADGDGFGNPAISQLACSAPSGFVSNSSDCNDANAAIKPTASEVCNNIDDNCNGTIDEGVKITFYRDADGDGFGNPLDSTKACTAPIGYVANKTDCNDASSAVRPNATETCNGIDDNCNGQIDENCCPPSTRFTSLIRATTARLNWTTIPSALGYKLQYRRTGTNPWTGVIITTNLGFLDVTGLRLSTTYEWQISTQCIVLNKTTYSAFSSSITFTTLVARLSNNQDPIEQNSDMLIYPNPTDNSAILEFTSIQLENYSLDVTEITGRIIIHKEGVSIKGLNQIKIDLSDFTDGVYFIMIISDAEEVRRGRLLKE